MAYTSGTAANYKDLLAIMTTFAAANGWVVLEQSETRVYLKGTGLAGLDEIYCGVETYEDPPNNRYNWNMVGSWGYRAGREIGKHPMSSNYTGADLCVACFWNTAIPYWMVATPRRIIVFAKIGTTYQSVHLGLLTPAGTDAQYPYPLFIGGSSSLVLSKNYSDNIYSFWAQGPYEHSRVSCPGGVWGAVNTSTNLQYKIALKLDGPAMKTVPIMLTALDGSYYLDPIFVRGDQARFVAGIMDGLYRVTGYNNSSENIITVAGINYMVFQDGSRTGFGDYCAMRLT